MSSLGYQLHLEEPLFDNVVPVTHTHHANQFVGKLYKKSQEPLLHNEISNLIALRSLPGVVSMQGVIEHNEQLVLIMDRMEGDVMDLLDDPHFTCGQGLDIFIQTCKILQQCHRHGIAHLDIKPENILFRASEQSPSGYEIKLTDFASSTQSTRVGGFFGTEHYGAPEAVFHLEYKGTRITYDTKRADLWSLGILLHVLLTKTWPFNQNNGNKIIDHVLHKQVEINSELPLCFRNIVAALLADNPRDRPSINWVLSQLSYCLEHPGASSSSPASGLAAPFRQLVSGVTKCLNLHS